MGPQELREKSLKALHLALRQVHQSPELRAARRLSDSLATRPLGASPRVLIVSMRDWAMHVHLEAVLGHALQLRGADIQHLTCGGGLPICDRVNTWEGPPMPCSSCARYTESALRAHGRSPVKLFPHTPRLDHFPDVEEMSLGELRDIEYRGVAVGRLVEIPVKWFLLADTIDEDPLGPSTYRAFLLSAAAILDSASQALDAYQPDKVLMLNGLFLFEAAIWELCRQRGIPVITYERAHMLDAVMFAHDHPAGLADLSTAWTTWAQHPLTSDENRQLDDYMDDRRHGRRAADIYWHDPVFASNGPRASGRSAVLFTNLVWDTAVIGQEVAFASLYDWVAATIDVFRNRPDDSLTIRVHPAEVKLSGRESRETLIEVLDHRHIKLPSNVTIIPPDDSLSSYSLMEDADVGLVYSSTVGLEMALAGKPVLVAAETHYRGKGFTLDPQTASDYQQLLLEQLDGSSPWQADLELARRYAYLFFFRAPYSDLGVREHVRGLIQLTARNGGDLNRGASADLDRVCESILTGRSFDRVAPDEPTGSAPGP